MRIGLVVAVAVLFVFAGCVTDFEQADNTSMNGSIHGETMASSPQLPVDDGQYVVVSEDVDYGAATGYLAFPAGLENAPGVVLIHEWWGLNDNIKATADKLASHGYRVLAVDLYGGQVAENSSQARELVGSVDQQEALENLESAQIYLTGLGSERIASWGFCFGGDQSMNLAVSEFAPDASIIYYGSPITEASQLASITQPVLGIFGAEDTSISVDSVNGLDEQLDTVGVVHEIIVYEGAGHAFANPSGDRFVEDAAADAWQETLDFLSANLS